MPVFVLPIVWIPAELQKVVPTLRRVLQHKVLKLQSQVAHLGGFQENKIKFLGHLRDSNRGGGNQNFGQIAFGTFLQICWSQTRKTIIVTYLTITLVRLYALRKKLFQKFE